MNVIVNGQRFDSVDKVEIIFLTEKMDVKQEEVVVYPIDMFPQDGKITKIKDLK
jgi:hypothetical protein